MANRSVAEARLPAGARSTATNRFAVIDRGSSLYFPADLDTVTVTPTASQKDNLQSTVAFWFNFTAKYASVNQHLFQQKTTTTTAYMEIKGWSSVGTLYMGFRWSGAMGTWRLDGFANKYPIGKWYHIIVSYDGSSVNNDPTLYINNSSSIALAEESTPSGTRSLADTIHIGGYTTASSKSAALINDVQLYNKILSASERTAMYYRGETASGLVGHWKLDEGSGSTAIDSTGNANGVITGATYSTNAPPHMTTRSVV